MPEGSCGMAALMAACTSRAASLMSVSKSKCSTTCAALWLLDELMPFTPDTPIMARSSGVATVADMLSGLAPGKLARTTMVGISACGKAATGKRK